MRLLTNNKVIASQEKLFKEPISNLHRIDYNSKNKYPCYYLRVNDKTSMICFSVNGTKPIGYYEIEVDLSTAKNIVFDGGDKLSKRNAYLELTNNKIILEQFTEEEIIIYYR